jgi:hypothetical protein
VVVIQKYSYVQILWNKRNIKIFGGEMRGKIVEPKE